MKTVNVLGFDFDDVSIQEAVERALWLMEENRSVMAVTPNPEMILNARKNKHLAAAIREAELVLPDGIGVIYASKILGSPIRNRIPGIDFASALMARMGEYGQRVFLLGGRPGVAEAAAEKLQQRYPGLGIAGYRDGYFKSEENDAVIEQINAAAPDLLLVCLGSPKQELWMRRNRKPLGVGLMIGLGGALDVYAGVTQRAPKKWRDLGLEWLYRLLKEPKRIKRMLKLPGILLAALWQRFGG